MHLHLDPVGGIAGDMFIAALLDTFPHLEEGLYSVLRQIGLPEGTQCVLLPHNDGVLSGHRFEIRLPVAAATSKHSARPTSAHSHLGLSAVQKAIGAMPLSDPVKERATAIFSILADAEAAVHGTSVDEVEFHEVGALDSIADVVGAAWIIEQLGAATWSVGKLPLGAGRVNTAHGPLPVPAPAVLNLLKGFAFHDDGLEGERVTPTGAAILRHLVCDSGIGPTAQNLQASGTGFGTRKLPGGNMLRVLAFEAAGTAAKESIALLQFEVDDQTPEDLALGLDRIRACEGVLDAMQSVGMGKKNRMVFHIQILARPQKLESVVAACFAQTTTLGIRHQIVERSVQERKIVAVADQTGNVVRVKIARRPDGRSSAKAESDDVRAGGDRNGREALRKSSEAGALDQEYQRDK